MIARLNVLKRTDPFDNNLRFPNSDEKIMTRLGEEGAILSLDPSPVGPFGEIVTRIALPARWSYGIKDDDEVKVMQDETALILSVAERRFRYSREGLARSYLTNDITGATISE